MRPGLRGMHGPGFEAIKSGRKDWTADALRQGIPEMDPQGSSKEGR